MAENNIFFVFIIFLFICEIYAFDDTNVIYVVDYCVVGDGVIDDRNAINSCTGTDECTIFFNGNYLVGVKLQIVYEYVNVVKSIQSTLDFVEFGLLLVNYVLKEVYSNNFINFSVDNDGGIEKNVIINYNIIKYEQIDPNLDVVDVPNTLHTVVFIMYICGFLLIIVGIDMYYRNKIMLKKSK